MSSADRTRAMIERLYRLNVAETWSQSLNPGQRAALAYLRDANAFSRAPSAVAEYLGSTRGTVSQTLKALARKGLIAEAPVDGDRRSIRYDVTDDGRAALDEASTGADALNDLGAPALAALGAALDGAIRAALNRRGGRSFGLCGTCRHHRVADGRRSCALLNVGLSDLDADLMCQEHASA